MIDDIKDIAEPHGMTIISATHLAVDHLLLLPTTLNKIEDADDDVGLSMISFVLR
jgi:hypothetical protein